MASRSLLLLALAAFAASASAQSIQSGLLYWCSFAENGPNMAGVAANQPRTYWQGVNANPPQFASVCHFGNRQTDNVVYTFSNGTAYPPNIPTSNYAVAPSTCQVRAPHMPSIHPSFALILAATAFSTHQRSPGVQRSACQTTVKFARVN